jgi:hypothetical protein
MTRENLPNRRFSLTFDFEFRGLRYACTFSHFADGRPAEIFLSNHKAGSSADTNCRDAAVAASLALQFGCPLETLRGAVLRDSNGTVASPLGQALDQIAKDMP